MEKRANIENCKLSKLRLLECSSKFIQPDFGQPVKLEVTIMHSIEFDVHSKENKSDFYLMLNTELKAIDNEKNEHFNLTSKFRGDYLIINSDNIDPKDFKDSIELLGHQLFPAIRVILTNILISMGISFPIPWSVKSSKNKKTKKREKKTA